MKLYKSDTKGVYFQLEELETPHLINILNQLSQRHQLLRTTLKQLSESFDNIHYKQALAYVEEDGIGILTRAQSLSNPDLATYEDLIAEFEKRQRQEKAIQNRLQQDLAIPQGFEVERNPKA